MNIMKIIKEDRDNKYIDKNKFINNYVLKNN